MKSDLREYGGPRTPLPEEWEAVLALKRGVFFPNGPDFPELFRQRPLAWHEDGCRNSFVMTHNGAPVSVITRLERDFVVHGCALRMGYIGGVCTHPDHRGRGLASTILAACMDAFRKHNVDFAHISGALPLYIRAGARPVGGRREFVLSGEGLAAFEDHAVSIRAAHVDDAAWMAECVSGDPVHFRRPASDYELSIQHGHCTGAASRFHIVSQAGAPVGYTVTTAPNASAVCTLFECAGPPPAILAAFHRLLSDGDSPARLVVEFAASDRLSHLLADAGLTGVGSALPRGTMKALDFAGTMAKLRPYVAARLPATTVDALGWTQGADRYVGWAGRDVLTIDGEQNMLWTLLGPPPDEAPRDVHATGAMAELLELCLPVPIPSIHLNNI